MSSPRCRTQAIAIWATVALLASATARNASTSELRSRFSPLKRGAVRRKSPSATSRSLDQWPLSRPRDSTPYAVTPTPSSRQVGRISASMPREAASTRSAGRRWGAPHALDGRWPPRPPRGRRGGRTPPAPSPRSRPRSPRSARRIEPSEPVDVDVVRPETSKRVAEEFFTAAGRPSMPTTVRCAHQAELHADRGGIAVPASERPADQELVVARRVVVAGVEEGDAGVEGGVDRRDALGLVGQTVEVGRPMQPRPIADTTGPAEPSVRVIKGTS